MELGFVVFNKHGLITWNLDGLSFKENECLKYECALVYFWIIFSPHLLSSIDPSLLKLITVGDTH